MTRQRWVYPAGSRSRDDSAVVIDESIDGWQYTGLTVLALDPGQSRTVELPGREAIVLPLSGGCTVTVTGTDGEHTAELAGRASVFTGPTDIVYAPADSRLTITADPGRPARIAVCTALAKAGSTAPFAYLPAAQVPVELRGAGRASREVRNFGTPQTLDATAIIACEVITPAGNFSSHPPHKHDVERPGSETELEEIYYFEVRAAAEAPSDADPVGYQRVYASDDRPIDVLAEVRSGDVVLVPYGWHGPAMALPGYDLYYLNVMAGPGPERAWLICDDPAHGWVRGLWADEPVDPRLPMGHPADQKQGNPQGDNR
ncbi:5-deoxy-glucuronate isomerase [Nakamurella lactea]|uniref:5-deoxy-glucuronate isomerase n=1 Tax=Nakamurella lactea TaxID=459515 RepID=UPI0004208091|nr:5-deoxy-glucuronate isomerase [Nakamurella lactea]